ncbi:MAG TPA: (2Fe-2S) ferredoxin domain-containing protein, partial [Thermodesulfobacteriota bacterium]|nr:(2Fe-2S) ferredoxin domain-containing protein [Thermodesulfobacteriota bacterium]
MKTIRTVSDLKGRREAILRRQGKQGTTIYVCGGTGCQAYGCQKVGEAFRRELRKKASKAVLKITGCPGFCERGPLVTIQPRDIFYERVKESDVPQIVRETVTKGKVIDRLLWDGAGVEGKIVSPGDVPFYRAQ